MRLTETYSRIRVGKNLYDLFPIRNGLKQGDARSIVSAFRFCFRVRHQEVSGKPGWLAVKLDGTHQLLLNADDVNILGGSFHTIQEKAKALVVATKKT